MIATFRETFPYAVVRLDESLLANLRELIDNSWQGRLAQRLQLAVCGLSGSDSSRAIADISTAASVPQSARGASCMHVHLPKPLHGWREFIGEVGIIVVGVLIALTAEQLVESWHWHDKLEQTTDELDAELHNDAVSAYDWLTVAPCVDQQLSSLEAALAAARQSGRVEATPPLTPPLEIFTEDAWLNARAMQVADHLPRDTVARYTKLFFLPRDLAGTVVELHKEASELRPLSNGSSPISSEEVGADQRQAGRVRELLDRVELGETLLLSQLDKIGIRPSPGERRRLLAANRAWAGVCAATPNLQRRFAPGDVN